MNALQNFLLKTDATNVTEVIKLDGRLGEFEMTIRALTGEQHSTYQTLSIENPTNRKKRSFNTKKFHELIVVNGLVEPSLKDAEWIKAAGVPDSTKLLYKTFLAGEISKIAEKILRLSGFSDDEEVEEAMEEVKNS